VDDRVIDQIAQMRQSVQELRQDSGDAQDFIKTMRSDVFQDRVYVFTPKGRVIDLPAGATPLDFAYHIHTEIGHRCRGARVNGRWTPLNYQLRTGEQVQIITGRTGGPSRDWLNEELGFVKTSRATQKIKQWFRQEGREQNISRGWAIVEQEIKRLGLSWTIDEVYNLFSKHFQRREDFLAAVGVADITSERIVNRIEDVLHREEGGEELPEPEIAPPPPPQSVGKVVIQGAGELLTRVALCCKPLPGEEIIGYVTRGRGVTIHRRDCPKILRLELAERDRLIEMDWGNEEETFAVQVIVTAYDRSALLRDITALMGNEGVNIVSVKTGKRDRYNILPIYLTLEVPNLRKLNRVLGKAEQIPNVIEARRSV
jgi:GTP pyrophosphokinase